MPKIFLSLLLGIYIQCNLVLDNGFLLKYFQLILMLNKFIPYNLKLDELIEEFPPFIGMELDKLIHIISLLNEIPAVDHKQYEKEDGWIPIHSTYIQKAGIRDFPKYKNWLTEVGVLETDGRYIPGEKATYYRFREKYRQPIIVEPISKKTLIKALNKKSKTDLISQKLYKDLYKWYSGLQIDVKAAEDYLLKKYELEKSKDVLNCLGKYNAGIINLNKIANGQIHFTIDKSAGRLHHNLSNIQSSLRNFLTYQGQPLVTIDIKNSQPAICTALLQPKFWELDAVIEKQSNIVGTDNVITNGEKNLTINSDLKSEKIEKLKINGVLNVKHIGFKDLPDIFHKSIHISSTPIMLAELHQTLDMADIHQFIKVVSEGQLYEFMEEQIQLYNTSVSKAIKDYTRKEIKTIMFMVFFTDNRFIGQKKATPKRIFKHIFPNVYKVLAMVKRNESKMLPLMLQKLESMIVLDRIAKRISKECPKLPIYTIHDSITTTVGNEEYVQKVMKEEIQNAIGIFPSLSIEYWTPDAINIAAKTNVA